MRSCTEAESTCPRRKRSNAKGGSERTRGKSSCKKRKRRRTRSARRNFQPLPPRYFLALSKASLQLLVATTTNTPSHSRVESLPAKMQSWGMLHARIFPYKMPQLFASLNSRAVEKSTMLPKRFKYDSTIFGRSVISAAL